jgi:hypothetical protein
MAALRSASNDECTHASAERRVILSKRRAEHARLCDGFRIDGLAETILGFRGRLAMNTLMYSDMSRAHQDEYNAVFSEPDALTSAFGRCNPGPFALKREETLLHRRLEFERRVRRRPKIRASLR